MKSLDFDQFEKNRNRKRINLVNSGLQNLFWKSPRNQEINIGRILERKNIKKNKTKSMIGHLVKPVKKEILKEKFTEYLAKNVMSGRKHKKIKSKEKVNCKDEKKFVGKTKGGNRERDLQRKREELRKKMMERQRKDEELETDILTKLLKNKQKSKRRDRSLEHKASKFLYRNATDFKTERQKTSYEPQNLSIRGSNQPSKSIDPFASNRHIPHLPILSPMNPSKPVQKYSNPCYQKNTLKKNANQILQLERNPLSISTKTNPRYITVKQTHSVNVKRMRQYYLNKDEQEKKLIIRKKVMNKDGIYSEEVSRKNVKLSSINPFKLSGVELEKLEFEDLKKQNIRNKGENQQNSIGEGLLSQRSARVILGQPKYVLDESKFILDNAELSKVQEIEKPQIKGIKGKTAKLEYESKNKKKSPAKVKDKRQRKAVKSFVQPELGSRDEKARRPKKTQFTISRRKTKSQTVKVPRRMVKKAIDKTSVKKGGDKSSVKKGGAKLREITEIHKMVCLLYGIQVIEDDSIETRIGYQVGPGNNQNLVDINLRLRKNMLSFSPFLKKCQFSWAQTSKRRNPISNAKDFQTIQTNPEDTNKFLAFLKTQKLFEIDSKVMNQLTSKISNNPQEDQEDQDHSENLYKIQLKNFFIFNHIKGMKHIGRKQLLTVNITEYCNSNPAKANIIPKTHLLNQETFEEDLKKCLASLEAKQEAGLDQGPWIIKPGEFSNRGKGIQMAYQIDKIEGIAKEMVTNRRGNVVLVQEYLKEPMLFQKRKFDLRCYALTVKFPGKFCVFWCKQGYARTSSYEYNADNQNNLMIHLTNEAVQVKCKIPNYPIFPLRIWKFQKRPYNFFLENVDFE